MSRCFPFPPPGYEKKARTDDVDLLKREKQKEKKHKKEKKEKEKRESKEKRENDRSDGKNRDKKDRKDKHRDKKKDNEKNEDKDKARSSHTDKKKISGHTEGQNREKSSDEKGLQGKSEGHSGREFSQKEKERNKDRNSTSGENKLAGQISGYKEEKLSQNSHLAQDFRNSKFVRELDRKVRDDETGAQTQLVGKYMGTEQKMEEGSIRLLSSKSARPLAEGKEKNKRSDNRRLDGQGIGEETLVCNLSEVVPTRVDGIPKQVEKHVDSWLGGKEKTKEKESDHQLGDKQKDGEKKSHGKDKDRDKEKKEEKEKAKGEQRNVEQGNLNKSNKADSIDTVNLKTSYPSKVSQKIVVVEDNLRKRKDFEKNGFVHANDIKPNKLSKSTSSSSVDNGMILQSCQASLTPFSSDGQGPATNVKVDSKECKVNGLIQAQMTSVSSAKPLLASGQAGQVDKVSTKPPHPDSKFLSQALSVPKMEEWCDFDAQEWLFENNGSRLEKPKMRTSEIDETPQVWADAMQIESADIYALPYVVPY